MIIFSKLVAKKIKVSFPCNRVGVTVIGLEVPHAHVHLIPLNEMKDMSFKHKIVMDNEAFIALAKKIKSNY